MQEEFGENRVPEFHMKFSTFYFEKSPLRIGAFLIMETGIMCLLMFFIDPTEVLAFILGLVIILIFCINAYRSYKHYQDLLISVPIYRNLEITKYKVIRDASPTWLEHPKLAPGDIIFLEKGDYVPADCRVLQVDSPEPLIVIEKRNSFEEIREIEKKPN